MASTDNPANIATRGKSPTESNSFNWWNGPSWMTKLNQQWPNHELLIEENSLKESNVEFKSNYEAKLVSEVDPIGEHVKVSDLFKESIHHCTNFFRITAYMLRVID